MRNLIERIKSGELWGCRGGIHPETHKNSVASSKPEVMPTAAQLVIPTRQHIGEGAKLLVKKGDRVLGGQPLTQSELYSEPPVHAPTSGVVIAIEPRPAAHPSGLSEMAVVIETDGFDLRVVTEEAPNSESLTHQQLVEAIHHAGISGMGGAGFPTAIKVAPRQPIEVLIINGAECEPYISADNSLMQHYSDELVQGIKLLQQLLNPSHTILAIEDDKPNAVAAMTLAAEGVCQVRAIPTKYPSGGEKQLISILTGRQVPAGGLPAHIGIVVQNVSTAYAIHRAVHHNEPLTRRLVTLAGERFTQARNVWVNIGTTVAHLIHECGPMQSEDSVIMGGPMMGFMLPDIEVPITKTSNCILYGAKDEFVTENHELACIRCGQCAQVCPVGVLPQQMVSFIKGGQLDKVQQYHLNDCIECGSCTYACPSKIPLVQYFRQGKAQLREERQQQMAAERAKQRFEKRQQRLEQEKLKKEQRMKQAKKPAALDNSKQTVIDAALSRVSIAKPEPMAAPGNKDAIAARLARKEQAQAVKAAKTANPAIAAAIERAKAKKAAATESDPQTSAPTNDSSEPKIQAATSGHNKNAAVAAAIARAKAKKAAQKSEASPAEPVEPVEPVSKPAVEPAPEDARKKAVAAAIARAKAKKAAQKSEASPADPVEPAGEPTVKPSPEDARKKAVAAAVARAKAKKAAEQTATSAQHEDTKSE